MKVQSVRTEELAAMGAEYNPRQISEHDMAALCASLERFGPVQPIVVNKRSAAAGWGAEGKPTIVGGHQRVAAAERIQLDKLPVVYVDVGEIEEKTLNLALNRISGEWDVDKLRAVLMDLNAADAELNLTGFDDTEIEVLLREDEQANDELAGEATAERDAANEHVPTDFSVLVSVPSEQAQIDLIEEMQNRGLTCRALVT